MNLQMKRIYPAILSLAIAASAIAAPIDEARKLYREGDYAAAAEQARKLVKRSPRDGNANFVLGASLMKLGETAEAVAPLKQAESRGVTEASQMLAEYALEQYDVEQADAHLEKWAATVAKSRNKKLPEEHQTLSSRLVLLRNMLERVEQIEIVDSLSVDSLSFFEAYRLSPQAGRILPPDALQSIGASGAGPLSVAYMPENNSEILWASTDTAGVYSLYGAGILDDGTLDHPGPLSDNLAEGGSALFPFLMPDGMTLYFANNGENSLGGYDIFMTRRSDDGYYQPQNVGMPYNSPDNDFLLAIDEASGLGWWATDRNHIPGKVTIYVFIPSQMRRNASPDDPNLAALAKLSDISLTRKPDTDYKALLEKRLPAENASSANKSKPRFALDMGNGKVYTALSDFRSERARSAMLEYLAASVALRRHLEQEDALRAKYGSGDRSVADAIVRSEAETSAMRTRIASLRNSVIRLENQ